MIDLLKIEWLKVKNYTGFILLTAFFALGVLATNYIVYQFKKNVIDNVQGSQLLFSGSPYDFDRVWQTTSYCSSFFLMLPALLMVILITNEFNFKTHRQNIIDGWSRLEFLNVKMSFAVLLALASTVMVIITAFIFGLVSGTSFSLTGFDNIAYFLLKAITYNMVGILIALLTRKSGVAIALFFIYTIFENGIWALLYFFSRKIKGENGVDLGDMNYLPMNASDGLLTSPFDNITKMDSGRPSYYYWVILAFALGYLVLFYWWSKKKMLNSDL